jgi:prepilin-type N-terminal cleavage/methylation domain-containing protein
MLEKYKKMKIWKKVCRYGFIKPRRESLESLNPRILEPYSKGFTLIEIIIVIVILSIVSAITIKFLFDSLRIYTMTVNQKTLFDEGKLALERMCRDIRDARTIQTPAAGGSGNTIYFRRSHATTYDVVSEWLYFRQNGTTLEKDKATPNVTVALASNVTGFTVTRGQAATNNANEITLVLTLSLTSGENVTLRTRVYPKNLAEDTTYKNYFRNWEELRS